jgi:type I restriction enzyme S subunit
MTSAPIEVYRLKDPTTFMPDYLDYLLKTKAYVAEYHCRSTGIRPSRLRMYSDDFFRVPIVRPPIKEQQQIVEFIAEQSKQIEKAIAAAEREIELMKEYRTTVIAAAITGRIDVRQEIVSVMSSNICMH